MRDRAAVLAWTATSLAVLSAVCVPVAASLWVADSVASAFFQQPDDVAQVSSESHCEEPPGPCTDCSPQL